MNSKNVVLIGLLASMLLIFFCVYFNAERYYKELELGNSKTKLTSSAIIDNAEKKIIPIEEFDTDISKEEVVAEELKDRVEEEEVIKDEETSSFFYSVENGEKIISGELPLLADGDSLKKFIAACVEENSCKNSVTFLDNGETLSWKDLVLSTIGLFDKVGVENPKISVKEKGIKLEGIFESEEAKNHLFSLLIDYKLQFYKIYDLTTIASQEKADVVKENSDNVKENSDTVKEKSDNVKEKSDNVKEEPKFTIIKDDIEKIQEEISQLLEKKQIHFEKNSGRITSEGKKVLDELVLALKDPENILLEVQGHTDAGGTKRVNLAISQRRANSVKKYLMSKGLKAENITAKGFGENKLLLPENPYSILNRRVEIYLKRK